MDNVTNCNICGKEGRVIFDMGGYRVRKCSECRFSWVEEVFDEQTLAGKDYYWASEFFIKNERLLRDVSRNEALIIQKYAGRAGVAGRKWLDIGSGFAYLISEAKKMGYEVTGIEVNKQTADYVQKREQLNILNKLVSETDLEKESFDIITMFDVLEHLIDPSDAVVKSAKYLKKGGLLAIEVPDDDSLIRKTAALIHCVTFGAWSEFLRQSFHQHPGGHRNGFTRRSLERMLEKEGFEVLGVKKTMIPYSLFISETVRKLRGLKKIIYFIFPSLLYFLSVIFLMQNRIKVYAKKV